MAGIANDAGGRLALDQMHPKDLSAPIADDIRTYDLVFGIIGALYEDVRTKRLNERVGRVVVKKHHHRNALHLIDHPRPRLLRLNGSTVSLQSPDRGVRIEGDDQSIARGRRLSDQSDMSWMNDIEAPVGEPDLEPVSSPSFPDPDGLLDLHRVKKGLVWSGMKVT